jgi:hypothetical protein
LFYRVQRELEIGPATSFVLVEDVFSNFIDVVVFFCMTDGSFLQFCTLQGVYKIVITSFQDLD